jgi:hypothetical protein
MIEQLDETNFLLYAARNYCNDQCYDTVEFYEDLSRFKYLKRLFKRYEETGELKERLILNHLVVLYNVFENEAVTRMLFLRLAEFQHMFKPFLILLGRLPEKVDRIGLTGTTYYTSDIEMDSHIVDVLRKI